jgi:hypothetical protein
MVFDKIRSNLGLAPCKVVHPVALHLMRQSVSDRIDWGAKAWPRKDGMLLLPKELGQQQVRIGWIRVNSIVRKVRSKDDSGPVHAIAVVSRRVKCLSHTMKVVIESVIDTVRP